MKSTKKDAGHVATLIQSDGVHSGENKDLNVRIVGCSSLPLTFQWNLIINSFGLRNG
jgi:hypothetical protein